jgi:hypothetical protein
VSKTTLAPLELDDGTTNRPSEPTQPAVAGNLVKAESAAARYVAHQTLMDMAYKIAGYPPSSAEPQIDGDPETGSINVEIDAVEGESKGRPSPARRPARPVPLRERRPGRIILRTINGTG